MKTLKFFSLAALTLTDSGLEAKKNKKPKLPLEKLTFINARFTDGKNVNNDTPFHEDGDCRAELAIDGNSPPDHYDKYAAAGYSSLWSYYNSNEGGVCNGAAQGNRGESLLLEIEEPVDSIHSFSAWPGIGWWFEDPFFKLSKLQVCKNADFSNCRECKRKVSFRCGKKFMGCAPSSYPELSGGNPPLTYKCKKGTTGQFVKVIVPPEPGKKWGFSNTDYAKFGLIEISVNGYITPDPPITCQCDNGTGSTDCPSESVHECSACNPGYYLDSNKRCVLKECSCDNGTGSSGINCKNNGDTFCQSCNNGHYLVGTNSERKRCKASNIVCLKRMYDSLTDLNRFVDVDWVDNSYIKVSTRPSLDNSNIKMAKFMDIDMDSFTVETGFVQSHDGLQIGWVPEQKTCYPDADEPNRPWTALWGPGECWDYDSNRGTNYYAGKNSGVGRASRDRYEYEGTSESIKRGINWHYDRWVVKNSVERMYDGSVWPRVTTDFLDGPDGRWSYGAKDSFTGPKKKKTKAIYAQHMEYEKLVPGIGIGKVAGKHVEIRVVDAECH